MGTRAYKQRGFTIVELLVSITLFAIAMIISTSTLLVVIDANAKAQAVNTAMTNVSFAMDSMTREIRTGYSYYCETGMTSLPPNESDCLSGGDSIAFTREKDGKRVGYRKNGTNIQYLRPDATKWVDITSNDVKIDSFKVYVDGAHSPSDSDYKQPEISMYITGRLNNGLDTKTTFSLQTLVTQKIIDL